MAIELDHFFILTEPGAPQADLLSGIGLIEGPRNHHPGQGTANRRFFFSNTGLELLYLSDVIEAETGRASRLRVAERARSPGASPFGLIVRSVGNADEAPFSGWKYCPEYFDDDQCFHVGDNSDVLEEPLCICMPTNLPSQELRPPPDNPDRVVTALRVSIPVRKASPTLETVADCRHVALQPNRSHLMELEFNGGIEGKSSDLRPELPLIVRW